MNKRYLSNDNTYQYPSGFRLPNLNAKKLDYVRYEDAKDELIPLYEKIFERINGRIPMKDVNEVVRHALVFFKGNRLGDVFILNHTNGALQGHFRAFAADTLNFIYTGHRTMSIQTWLGLFRAQEATYVEQLTGLIKDTCIIDTYNALKVETKHDNAIALWVSREKGIEDLLSTLMILFVDIRHYPSPIYQPIAGT